MSFSNAMYNLNIIAFLDEDEAYVALRYHRRVRTPGIADYIAEMHISASQLINGSHSPLGLAFDAWYDADRHSEDDVINFVNKIIFWKHVKQACYMAGVALFTMFAFIGIFTVFGFIVSE